MIKTSLRVVCVLLTIVALTACMTVKRPDLERRYYLLAVQRPETAASRPDGSEDVLAVRAFRVTPAYDGKRIVSIGPQGRVDEELHHRFFLPPGEMIAGLLRNWLADAALFAQVTDLGSFREPDLILEGSIQALYRDLESDSPRAVLGLQMLLLRQGGTGVVDVVLQRDYRRDVDLTDASIPTLIQGWNQALSLILLEFEAELRSALAASVPSLPASAEGT